ncbi:uncharacterized protein LOC122498437 isoform X2 [Leptopilina heterotoma]|uniref:uncharacterized protein LOC122498437 isoform X2 n=1 Tax=Leptopilina heterotoma TaxID=63436 RepID=UPI001CA9C280|nr:uncharacterized protein LOC122498437 isoform X2 [Leptopilina heterotoma]
MNRIAFQLALLSSLLFPSGFVLWKILQPNQKNDTTSTATKVPKEPSLDNFGIYQYDGDVFIALKELPASLKGDIRQKSATNDTCIIEWNSPETFGSLIKYDMTMYNKSNNVLWNGSLLVPHEVVSSHKFQHLQPQNTYDIQLYRQNNRGLSTHPIKGSCTTTP